MGLGRRYLYYVFTLSHSRWLDWYPKHNSASILLRCIQADRFNKMDLKLSTYLTNYDLNSGNERRLFLLTNWHKTGLLMSQPHVHGLVKQFEQDNRRLNKLKDITVCTGLYLFHRVWKGWEWKFSDQSTGRGRWIWCQSDLLNLWGYLFIFLSR